METKAESGLKGKEVSLEGVGEWKLRSKNRQLLKKDKEKKKWKGVN